AVLAGVAIVVMAISLDRVTEAIANRTDPARKHLDATGKTRARVATVVAAWAIGLAAGLGRAFGAGAVYSRSTAHDWLLHYVQNALNYVQKPTTFLFKDITNPIGNFLVQHVLVPLDTFLTHTPWFITFAGLVAIAFVMSGVRPAVIAAVMFGTIVAV